MQIAWASDGLHDSGNAVVAPRFVGGKWRALQSLFDSQPRLRRLFELRRQAWLGLLLYCLAVFSGAAQMHVVTNCTETALRAAMAEGGTVTFACDGIIAIDDTITNSTDTVLDATGHSVTISGRSAYRVFFNHSNTSFTIMNLEIADGRSVLGGAGIYNDGGTLSVRNCVFSNNVARGSSWLPDTGVAGSNVLGGAVFNGGMADIQGSIFVTNLAVGGAGTGGVNDSWTGCKEGGNGGTGGSGYGGAIYNAGELSLMNSAFSGNAAVGGVGGDGGRGGGGCIGGAKGGNGAAAGSAFGGALCNAGVARLVNTTLSGNSSTGGGGGAGGSGGGFLSMYGGDGGNGGTGGAGLGGAIYDLGGSCLVTNCTVALNAAIAGAAGPAGYGGNATYGNGANGLPGQAGSASGGGFSGADGAVMLNVLLATNAPQNCAGSLVDAGYNLSSDPSGFTNSGSLNGVNALLGPLMDNGGTTLTMALLPGSPAIDAGNTVAAHLIDQRGAPRPIGPASDIGAYECGAPGFIDPPVGRWAPMGSTTDFSATATGYPPLSYQWIFNATNRLDGATNSSMRLANVQFAQTGDYTLVVTNAYGAVTSPPARLEVFSHTVTGCTDADLRASLGLGGTVTLGCDGTFLLTNVIVIDKDTTLDSSGHQATISGGDLFRVFQVNTNVSFTLLGMTISRGLSTNGGGIWSAGTLNATNCIFARNTARGLSADPSVNLWVPTAGNGGAIYSLGSFSADRCSFLQNSAFGGRGSDSSGIPGAAAAAGGAIYSLGLTTITRSVFATNQVTGGQGGQGNPGWAGGDQAWPGSPGGAGGNAWGAALFAGADAELIDCTFAGNTSTGGMCGPGGPGGYVWHDGFLITAPPGPPGPGGDSWGALCGTNGVVQFIHCTIAENAGIAGTGIPTGGARGALAAESSWLVNTILANNFPTNGSGGIADAGHNLSSDASCGFTASGSRNSADPRLGPLADNGGPTLTMALLPGSPAIDAADPAAAPPTDQRGGSRPAGAAPDIGAYEYGSFPLLRFGSPQAGAWDLTIAEVLVPSCRLLTSTNLADWVTIATRQIGPEGTASFRVPVDTAELRRFYRVALP